MLAPASSRPDSACPPWSSIVSHSNINASQHKLHVLLQLTVCNGVGALRGSVLQFHMVQSVQAQVNVNQQPLLTTTLLQLQHLQCDFAACIETIIIKLHDQVSLSSLPQAHLQIAPVS